MVNLTSDQDRNNPRLETHNLAAHALFGNVFQSTIQNNFEILIIILYQSNTLNLSF